MSRRREDIAERTLRWMTENLNGAYGAQHPAGHASAGRHCTNSGTCVLACCYINALGKVLLKGGPSNGPKDFARFREFLRVCMADFINESSTRGLPLTPKGKRGGDEWLYEVFRCGFVHTFYPAGDVTWGRHRTLKKYWFTRRSKLTLNIDELVRGFERGVHQFKRQMAADPELRSRFKEYISAN